MVAIPCWRLVAGPLRRASSARCGGKLQREVGDQLRGDAGVYAVREVRGEAEDVAFKVGVLDVGVEVEAAEQAEWVRGEVAAGAGSNSRRRLWARPVSGSASWPGRRNGHRFGSPRTGLGRPRVSSSADHASWPTSSRRAERPPEVVGDHGVAGSGGEAREGDWCARFTGPGDDVAGSGLTGEGGCHRAIAQWVSRPSRTRAMRRPRASW